VGRACAVAVGAVAFFAVLGAVQAGVAVVDQRVDVAIGDGMDGAAATAVAAVRAAEGDEFFATETGGAIAALAGDDFDGGFVNEFHGVSFVPSRLERRVEKDLSWAGGACRRIRLWPLSAF